MASFLNHSINLLYTALFFWPVVKLWWQNPDTFLLTVILVLSFIPFLLPTHLFLQLQLSSKRRFYEGWGIRFWQQFTQQGKLINRLAGEQKPMLLRKEFGKIKAAINRNERYHYAALVCFLGSLGYAISLEQWQLAGFIFVANGLYNIIPLLIQQYNKIRIGILRKPSLLMKQKN